VVVGFVMLYKMKGRVLILSKGAVEVNDVHKEAGKITCSASIWTLRKLQVQLCTKRLDKYE